MCRKVVSYVFCLKKSTEINKDLKDPCHVLRQIENLNIECHIRYKIYEYDTAVIRQGRVVTEKF